MSRLTALLAAAVLTTGRVALAPPADAATYASSGQRCTKVGTARADRLVGTSRADVICGLGGNDTIYGGGANDVIDAGYGNDVVHAGAGNDRVYAGYGSDSVHGDAGNDSLGGQGDSDTLDGGLGNDVVSGSYGNDRVTGGTGDDRVAGGAGNDTVSGSYGQDVVSGDLGNDTVSGDVGDDDLFGGAGDDDMTGGPGLDDLDGGAGTNWCDEPSEDQHATCKIDLEDPVVHELRLDRTSVDVSDAAGVVTGLVHVTDDTGVSNVHLNLTASGSEDPPGDGFGGRVSGTVRDGWWRLRIDVPRYLPATTLNLAATATDRLSRTGYAEYADQVTVLDRNPDLQLPVLQSLEVSTPAVDVRTAAAEFRVRVHITDDASGVQDAFVCAVHRGAEGYEQVGTGCSGTSRTSGTARDGWWDIPYELPRYTPSGDYTFRACFNDTAHTRGWTCWIPDAEADLNHIRGLDDLGPRVPGGGGRLAVRGLDDDVNAPVLGTVTATPSPVDASHGARTVRLDVAASDVEGLDRSGVAARVTSEDGSIQLSNGFWPTLVSGTDQDGVWRFELDVPGGTPPGRYVIEVWLQDNTHQVGYAPAEHLFDGSGWSAFTTDQSATGGYLTVQ